MSAPDDKRCAELADNYEFLADMYRGDDADESVRCADIAAALRAIPKLRALAAEWNEVSVAGDSDKHRTMGYCASRITAILGATETPHG